MQFDLLPEVFLFVIYFLHGSNINIYKVLHCILWKVRYLFYQLIQNVFWKRILNYCDFVTTLFDKTSLI